MKLLQELFSHIYEGWYRKDGKFSTEMSDLQSHFGKKDPKCPACKKEFKINSLHKNVDGENETTHWFGTCPPPCGAKLTIFND